MRKRKKGRKFGRKRDQRKAFLRNLIRELLLKRKITTTLARAKEIRPMVEKLITKAKDNNLATRRYLLRKFDKLVVDKLLKEIAPSYKERKGGYTRIIHLSPRKSNGAKMAIIELI